MKSLVTETWPPYCGAENIRIMYTAIGGGRVQYRPQVADAPETLKKLASLGKIDVEVEGICTRKCHPVTEQHVDVERGLSWPEPGHYVTDPFRPSSA